MKNFKDFIGQAIYVVHALKGYEFHEKRVIELFGENNLSFEFMADGDVSLITADVLEKYFIPGIEAKLSKGILSCTLNHILCYEKIVAKENRYGLVFENDPFFLTDFPKGIEKLIPEIEKLEGGFLISLENSTLKFPSYWQTQDAKHLYRARMGRMAGAYLINLEGATCILEDLKHKKCDTVIDWWHNDLIERGVVKMYWAHPPLVEQGSHNGYLNSTISSKPRSVTRRISWVILKYFVYYFKRLFNEKRLVD